MSCILREIEFVPRATIYHFLHAMGFSPSLFFPLPTSSSLHIPCSNHFICYRLKLVESYWQCVVHKWVDATGIPWLPAQHLGNRVSVGQWRVRA
jgi:hypothetical protein